MGLAEIGFEPDGLAVFGDRRVELALLEKG